MHQAPGAMAIMSGPRHVFTLANPLYCHILGRTEEARLGKTYREAFPELAAAAPQRRLERAQDAARAKDEFLAMLGHELRLAPIVSALHVMQARQDSTTEREQAVIRRQVKHMSRLVDDFARRLAHCARPRAPAAQPDARRRHPASRGRDGATAHRPAAA